MDGDVGIEFGDEVGIEEIVGAFDIDKFTAADKTVRSATTGYMYDSKTIRRTIDDMNNKVRKAASKKKSKIKFVQAIYEIGYTLLNKDAVAINNSFQEQVNDILKKSEGLQKGFSRDIMKHTRSKERLLDQVAGLQEDYESFNYAKKGYSLQIGEIDGLLEANRNGVNVEDIALQACPSEYRSLSARSLQKNRASIESKLLNAETELQTKESKAEILDMKIQSVEKSIDYSRSQFTKALRNRDRQLKQQIDNFAPAYIEALVGQAKISEVEEEMEEVIRGRNEIAGVLYEEMANNSNLLIDGYQADYGDTSHITDAKNSLDEAMGQQISSTNEGRELQKTGAKAVFEKYLG